MKNPPFPQRINDGFAATLSEFRLATHKSAPQSAPPMKYTARPSGALE
jgi:hypothetical protein